MHRALLTLLLCLFVSPLWAEEPEPSVLRVGISEVPPFAIQDAKGEWRGISADLWRSIAEQAGYRFEYQALPFAQLLPALERGELDVVVGALTMTAEREARFDFTHPFFQSGMAIAVPPGGGDSGWHALKGLFSWQFVSLLLGLAALLLAVGALLWVFERRRNREQFGGTPVEGLGASFWWAAVTMTTVGYGDKAPVTLGGRLIALVWMFAGLIMVSTFTAAVTSTLTVGNLQGGIQSVDDLRRSHVATVANTVSERYLDGERIRHSAYPDLLSAMRAVQAGEVEAVVYDLPILQYRNGELDQGGLRILPGTFENQSYAFAVASGSPYREELSQEILRFLDSEGWRRLQHIYLGRP